MNKFTWTTEVLMELWDLKTRENKTLTDLVNFIFSKYGKQYTQARISQVLKQYKESLNAN